MIRLIRFVRSFDCCISIFFGKESVHHFIVVDHLNLDHIFRKNHCHSFFRWFSFQKKWINRFKVNQYWPIIFPPRHPYYFTHTYSKRMYVNHNHKPMRSVSAYIHRVKLVNRLLCIRNHCSHYYYCCFKVSNSVSYMNVFK